MKSRTGTRDALAKHAGKERGADVEPLRVDAVAKAGAEVPLDLEAGRAEAARRGAERHCRYHLVGFAMDGRIGGVTLLMGEPLRREQQPGIADNAGDRLLAAWPDIKRHDRALAEARPARRDPRIGHSGRGRHRGTRRAWAPSRPRTAPCRQGRSRAKSETPLAAARQLVASVGHVRRGEGSAGEALGPDAAEVDEIVAVGAVAVQEDDERVGLPPSRDARPVEHQTRHCGALATGPVIGPEQAGGDAAPGRPARRRFGKLIDRQRWLSAERVAETARLAGARGRPAGKDVGMAEAEEEIDVRRPRADALDRGEAAVRLLGRQLGQRLEIEPVADSGGDGAERRIFAPDRPMAAERVVVAMGSVGGAIGEGAATRPRSPRRSPSKPAGR